MCNLKNNHVHYNVNTTVMITIHFTSSWEIMLANLASVAINIEQYWSYIWCKDDI